MRRRKFLAGLSALFAASCARHSQRSARYDENECPFCTTSKGSCTYCGGSGTCSFCDGKGSRLTVVPDNLHGENATPTQYQEKCSYCGGSGVCRYCEGEKKCAVCNGSAKVSSWDFFGKHKQKKQS